MLTSEKTTSKEIKLNIERLLKIYSSAKARKTKLDCINSAIQVRQAFKYDKLSQSEIDSLNDVGFKLSWNDIDQYFMLDSEKFAVIKNFYIKNNKLPEANDYLNSFPVGKWYSTFLKESLFNKNIAIQIEKLQAKDRKTKRYQSNILSCDESKDSKTPTNTKIGKEKLQKYLKIYQKDGIIGCVKDKEIANWIRQIRRRYKDNELNPDLYEFLNNNGFPWEFQDIYWDYKYDLISDSLPSITSLEAEKATFTIKDKQIGNFAVKIWLKEQVDNYDSLSDIQKEKIDVFINKKISINLEKNKIKLLKNFSETFKTESIVYRLLEKSLIKIFSDITKADIGSKTTSLFRDLIPKLLTSSEEWTQSDLAEAMNVTRERARQIISKYNNIYFEEVKKVKNTFEIIQNYEKKSLQYKLSPEDMIFVNEILSINLSFSEIVEQELMSYYDLFNGVLNIRKKLI